MRPSSLLLLRRHLSVDESKALRSWISGFKLFDKQDCYEFSFSKSSGPGEPPIGQLGVKFRLQAESSSLTYCRRPERQQGQHESDAADGHEECQRMDA